MNKKILLTLIFALTIVVSIGAIYASDVNETDSYIAQIDDTQEEISVDSTNDEAYGSNVDNDASIDVLGSEASSTLSTNAVESNVLTSAKDVASTVDVSKSVTSKDVTKYYKGSTKYTATFLDGNGSALANTAVNIVVDGAQHVVKTNSKGVASLSINLKPGTYKVTATNPVTGYSLTNSFKILSTITAKDISKVSEDARKFSAKFLKSNGKPLAKKTIKFKINGKTYKVKTNSKGIASLSLTNLKKGTYDIISYNTDGLTKTNKVKVYSSVKTSLTASDYTFLRKNKKIISVKLLNQLGYAPPKGKIINFKVNGNTYSAATNSKGVASLKLPVLKEGTYTVKYSFAKSGHYKASSTTGKVYVLPTKDPTFTVKSTTIFGHDANTPFKVALTSGKVPIVGKTVTLSVAGSKFTKTTNSKGIVSLPIGLNVGDYVMSYSKKGDSKTYKKSGSTKISVIERTPANVALKSSSVLTQGTRSCQILFTDVNNKPISGATVKLTVNSQVYTAKTAANGYATFNANFAPGDYKVTYEFLGNNLNAPTTGQIALSVKKTTTFSVKNIITSSANLKTYYQNNNKLPNTVAVGGITLSVPEFLYLMSQAITQLSNSNFNDIPYIQGVAQPQSPGGDNIQSKQLMKANYLTVAKNVANFISSNKLAPNYASSNLGKIGYVELVDAFARTVAFYGTDNMLPNYVTIKPNSGGSSASVSGRGLNENNNIVDLTPYLKATKNCQVGNSQIKSMVNKLTQGLTSDSAKATAIFNYVRDQVSYSFYYDTKYGAVNTLNYKTGNCVDQSHLLAAMFRTAGLATRYVHGTCYFTSSGSTYGHVWTQVLVNGKWTVADATSVRNSLGNVVNWNTKSYTIHGIYSAISF